MPQYFKNDLCLVPIDKVSLQNTLTELREAIVRAFALLKANSPAPDINDTKAFGSLYTGDNAKYLGGNKAETDALISSAYSLAKERLSPHLVEIHPHHGQVSPTGSVHLGAAFARTFAAAANMTSRNGGVCRIHSRDVACVCEAFDHACDESYGLGYDDALSGRAGLLRAVLAFRHFRLDRETAASYELVFKSVPLLVDCIIEAGKIGAEMFVEEHGESGILAILLECKLEELGDGAPESNHLPIIGKTITQLCKLTIANEGHLPSSLPHNPLARRSPLVQICHGAPGFLVLLARARGIARLASLEWEPCWDHAIYLASQRVWEQGLIFKGGGLCHGIAGNAWPFLMLHNLFEYGPQGSRADRIAFSEKLARTPPPPQKYSADQYLSRALAFLLHVRKTQPFNTHTYEESIQYRMPDHPYSLYEGLSGTMVAWAEACVVIVARLRKMEVDEIVGHGAYHTDGAFCRDLRHVLGIPGIAVQGYI
ncbi:lanthionine synthetase C family protein, putative [Trichophyton verrucosum HKI 0517]|uniref:Lanthionine synthetase C family protein, putative n=1 Tax=Trichophyton verrucosum (strain HKI 0517) TaxID=663202 RepID=D4DEI3_TRIVH|nr:lanthionine synthetase C family protein, putative [Trichophyton verrucosum HKI 0517]EFE39739.1 lanthionine synthetase C family protein, putative [Trichophyton verrucosum HKI 0517]